MIVPENITNYKLDKNGLQEYALFCLMVFNKNANQTAVKLENMIQWAKKNERRVQFRMPKKFESLFTIINGAKLICKTDEKWIVENFRFGNTTVKSKGLEYLINNDIDLKNCSVDELEKIPGFGMKTSRFFVLHTRKDAEVACLDTHILEWLSYYTSCKVTKAPSRLKYLELEEVFLDIAKSMKTTPAELDLKIWNKQRGSNVDLIKRI